MVVMVVVMGVVVVVVVVVDPCLIPPTFNIYCSVHIYDDLLYNSAFLYTF